MSSNLFKHADSYLTIDLGAIAKNWHHIDAMSSSTCTTAAMVKANGYGLGSVEITQALAKTGCQQFFVASIGEAIALRSTLAEAGYPGADIMVLHGVQRGQEADLANNGIIPVLNDLEQISRWRLFAGKAGVKLPCLLHFDTGMTRLGLDHDQTDWLIENPLAYDGLDINYVMSHLVSAEIASDPVNTTQLARFREIRRWFPGIPASLANSAGCMMGPDYHFQMTRPGIALYGIRPSDIWGAALQPVLGWHARIMQIRSTKPGDRVGYNGTFEVARPSRIATIGVGYADGYSRHLGNTASVAIGIGVAPVIGRISMDSITVDVTDLDADSLRCDSARLIHDSYSLDKMASDCGTIPYEIMTQLGQRAQRDYHHI